MKKINFEITFHGTLNKSKRAILSQKPLKNLMKGSSTINVHLFAVCERDNIARFFYHTFLSRMSKLRNLFIDLSKKKATFGLLGEYAKIFQQLLTKLKVQ
jgi:hypothetical protein